MPVHNVLGNHDAAVEPENQSEVLRRLGLDKLGDKKGYYDFARAGWRFVVLNGNDVSVLAHAPGSAQWKAANTLLDDLRKKRARNAQDWNGALGSEQLKWLDRTLAKAERTGERVLVFCHYPVYPPSSHTLWNDSEVLAILESHKGVVAYLCGHKHDGDYALINGAHYLTFAGMVETNETAYALVEVYSDRLCVTGFGREPRRVLQIQQN
jgi:3',5'-cyclic AMP phosphodiesterase CpdA